MADLAAIYRSLSALHRAGIGWPAALRQGAPPGGVWEGARTRVDAGQPLSQALDGCVPGLDLALLAAGERSGGLEGTLESLATRTEARRRRASERRAALAYPVLLAHVAALLLPLPDLMRGRWGAALLWCLAPLSLIYGVLWLSRRTPPPGRPLPYRFPYQNRLEEEKRRGAKVSANVAAPGAGITHPGTNRTALAVPSARNCHLVPMFYR